MIKIIKGNWSNDLYCGFGTYFFKSKEKYEGEWKDDLMDGQGKFNYSNGDQFIGEFLNP